MLKITVAHSGLGLALMLMVFMSPVQAEEKKQTTYELEAVKVTAQKREENVQQVPMSIGVLNDLALDEGRAHELSDIHRLSPNLYMSSAGGSTTFSYLGLRGRINSGMDIDPTVTVIVDGVPYDDFYAMGANPLFDVERVEVLRGSQSTLYGLNSMGGVVNIVTKKPGDTFRLQASAEGGWGPSRDGSWMLRAGGSGPLFEGVLAGGLSFMAKSDSGYIKNLRTGENYNDELMVGGRGNLVWTPSRDFEASFGMSYTDVDAGNGYIALPVDDDAADSIGQDRAQWESDLDWEGGSHVRTWAPNLKLSYDAGPVEIVSITAYRNTEQEYDFDMDLTSAPTMSAFSNNEFKTLTQEVRLQSADDEESDFQWTLGYFYNTFHRDSRSGVNILALSMRNEFVSTVLKGNSNAMFGQATYRALDKKLGFTLGLRQEWTSRDLHDRVDRTPDLDFNDSQFLPKFAIDYRLTPEDMVYVSATQGWRSGGLNIVTNSPQLKFQKETCWTLEAGAKTKFFDDRLLLNASVFHSIYKDYQDRIGAGPLIAYLANAGGARITGFELEMEARLTESLLFTGSLGYAHATYGHFPDADFDNFKGKKVLSVPDFDFNAALKYTFLKNYYIRPEVQGTGKIYWDRANTRSQDPYYLFNLKAGYADDHWEAYVYGENLTNKYAFAHAGGFLGNGNLYGTPIKPLKVGAGMSWNF